MPKTQTNPFAMRIDSITVNDRKIATDRKGYIQDRDDWSEGFATAIAKKHGVTLTEEH